MSNSYIELNGISLFGVNVRIIKIEDDFVFLKCLGCECVYTVPKIKVGEVNWYACPESTPVHDEDEV